MLLWRIVLVLLLESLELTNSVSQQYPWDTNYNRGLSTRFDFRPGGADIGSGDGADDSEFGRPRKTFGQNYGDIGSGGFITDDEDLIDGSGYLPYEEDDDDDYFKITTPFTRLISTTTTTTTITTTTTTTTTTPTPTTTITTTITTTTPSTTTTTTVAITWPPTTPLPLPTFTPISTTYRTTFDSSSTTSEPISVGYDVDGSGLDEYDEEMDYSDVPRNNFSPTSSIEDEVKEVNTDDFVFETPTQTEDAPSSPTWPVSPTKPGTTPSVPKSPSIPKNEKPFGPTSDSAFLLENHLVLVSLYAGFVLLLVIAILIGFCTINRCRSYDIIENSSDASSDLMIKKRPNQSSLSSSDDSERGAFCFGSKESRDNQRSLSNPNWL